ncbi:protein SIEVE ELEMENT OCCLUSION B-like [Juglans microcarpa x Juglans regia]|uniref:protein SIEVE ELEMENT OCCLUSION B-like n=1 Tax=Juglans microcarpa x Juglans regia TaxID=2249226 RepID=UPI001B7F4C25|nr:protein SIEVE ELEMENT OCCLUSION B-like [Juglans microcarpa x Juglans regia]
MKLKNRVKNTLELIKGICKLHELLRQNYIYGVLAGFSTAKELVPVVVYWSINSLVACMIQMYRLASEEDNTQDLSPLAKKIETTYDSLKEKIKLGHRQKGDACWENDFEYCKMDDHLEIPEEIAGAFMDALIVTNDKLQIDVIDGSTANTQKKGLALVSINVLKKKNILLLISSLDISDDEISIVKLAIDDEIRKKGQYKIEWIPIAEQWTDHDTQNKFESQCCKMKSWYILRYSSLEGIELDEYLSNYAEEWQFKEPMVVVINPQGELENPNAFRVIRLAGMDAFPFTMAKEKSLVPVPNIPVLGHPKIEKSHVLLVNMSDMTGPYKLKIYKFYYGGKEKVWIQQFTSKKNILVNDPVIRNAKVCIDFCFVGKGRLIINQDKKFESDEEKNFKLLIKSEFHLLKNKDGWLVLTEGSTVLIFTSNQGAKILKVFDELDNWKNSVQLENDFDACFKEYHDKLL